MVSPFFLNARPSPGFVLLRIQGQRFLKAFDGFVDVANEHCGSHQVLPAETGPRTRVFVVEGEGDQRKVIDRLCVLGVSCHSIIQLRFHRRSCDSSRVRRAASRAFESGLGAAAWGQAYACPKGKNRKNAEAHRTHTLERMDASPVEIRTMKPEIIV